MVEIENNCMECDMINLKQNLFSSFIILKQYEVYFVNKKVEVNTAFFFLKLYHMCHKTVMLFFNFCAL